MDLLKPVLTMALAVTPLACIQHMSTPVLERRTERSFAVSPGSIVRVSVSGGPITVTTGAAGRVEATLLEEVFAETDEAADDVLSSVESIVSQQGDEVTVSARRTRSGLRQAWDGRRVRFSATLAVPADVRLDLDTSGGRITVQGDRSARIEADTSGGSITVECGTEMRLDTSGGGIHVGQVLGLLDAETSGGSISIRQIESSVRDVRLHTSGGSIRVGIDPDADLAIDAATSGGSVDADGLPLQMGTRERSHIRGRLNDGAGRLAASTSGGSIQLYASEGRSLN
jgi:hypothetical protein